MWRARPNEYFIFGDMNPMLLDFPVSDTMLYAVAKTRILVYRSSPTDR